MHPRSPSPHPNPRMHVGFEEMKHKQNNKDRGGAHALIVAPDGFLAASSSNCAAHVAHAPHDTRSESPTTPIEETHVSLATDLDASLLVGRKSVNSPITMTHGK